MTAAREGLITHYLRYSAGSVLVIMAGLVSFPVLTRLLDNTQYGILGYYDTWVLMAIAIGKLGAQHAIMRFYPHGGDSDRLRAFSTNLFYLPLAISLLLWALGATALALFDVSTGARQPDVFWLALMAAPLMIFASLVETVLRATENSRMVMVTRVSWRWLELLLMLGAVVTLQHSAFAAYGGKLAAAVIVVVWYLRWMRTHLVFSRAHVDVAAMRQGLWYGLPLVANEIMAVALVALDRLMIKAMTGDFAAVGIYSIGAALAMQVSVFTSTTVFEAFTPAVTRAWQTGGAEAVRALKTRVLLPMAYASIGVAALLWCFGTDIIIALSGNAKAASGPVFTGMAVLASLTPLLMLSGYGLMLQTRSVRVMALMAVTLATNVAFNLLWIPRFGVMGAVYATMVSSTLHVVMHCVMVPRPLLQLPDPRSLLTASVVAGVAVWVVSITGAGGLGAGWPRLLIGASSMAIVYALAVLALDARLRALVPWRRFARRRGLDGSSMHG